jgi:midasin
LAKYSERELIVQNLSLQTDSTDLLGGFRPLEMQHVAQKVYQSFVDIFVATFSRKQNAEFLNFAATALAKRDWKKLSQCFVRAAKLGLGKVKQRSRDASATSRACSTATLQSWRGFSDTSERFERQRLACDSGLVFAFSEGALVDAIREGKWYVAFDLFSAV